MTPSESSSKTTLMLGVTVALGVLTFITLLASHHIADGDLWGKLAIGAHVWHYGAVPDKDTFAFTPVLPHYIEHEWGAGTIFYGVLKYFGGQGLMALKILLALGAMFAALAAGRRSGASWNTLLVLAIPATVAILPGYIPVIRSHAFTYCFFALTLFALEELRAGKSWPVGVLPAVMFLWSNIHGGFVAGLGAIAVYTAFAVIARQRPVGMVILACSCALVTLINIYGLKYWPYLIPALLHKRPRIAEWQPLPLLGDDPFIGFRILFVLVVLLLLVTWKRTQKKSWPGLVMLAVTAILAWRSRRHAPFFGVAALAFTGPFLETALKDLGSKLSEDFRDRFQPAFAVLVLYGLLALYAAKVDLPDASFTVLAPVGHDPVREADILSLAQAEGNCATPFGWGCYVTWRLYPKIKVSMDGRYETTYPESTFEMNADFYDKRGTNWDRLIRDYPVDYVILEFTQSPLRPEDLTDHGYKLIWVTDTNSALMALDKDADKLREVATNLPPTTINPLDARMTDGWWGH